MLIVVVEVKRELKNRHHRPCCVVIDARHVMMKANGVTDKVGQFPVARDEIANYAMIGIKASIFSLQIDPVPLPFQIHFPAIRREPLHQDRNERDFGAPIVSVSLGLPAVFLWGGLRRSDAVVRLRLHDGDVLVWGGPDRLRFHGVQPVAAGSHPRWGAWRINLTFRKAG